MGANQEITTYTYWDPSTFGAGTRELELWVVHPGGSWEYYYSYDTNGNPTVVYSSFEDIATNTYTSARQTTYDYTSSPVSGSGDDDTISPSFPREVIQFIGGNEVSRSHSFFPSIGVRVDAQ